MWIRLGLTCVRIHWNYLTYGAIFEVLILRELSGMFISCTVFAIEENKCWSSQAVICIEHTCAAPPVEALVPQLRLVNGYQNLELMCSREI